MAKTNCLYCEEPLSGHVPFFGDDGFCNLNCVAEYGDTCGRPIHREMLDWRDLP